MMAGKDDHHNDRTVRIGTSVMAIHTPYMPEPRPAPTGLFRCRRARAIVFLGFLIAGLLFGGVGAWATLAPSGEPFSTADTVEV